MTNKGSYRKYAHKYTTEKTEEPRLIYIPLLGNPGRYLLNRCLSRSPTGQRARKMLRVFNFGSYEMMRILDCLCRLDENEGGSLALSTCLGGGFEGGSEIIRMSQTSRHILLNE